jgi:hypothetical protein
VDIPPPPPPPSSPSPSPSPNEPQAGPQPGPPPYNPALPQGPYGPPPPYGPYPPPPYGYYPPPPLPPYSGPAIASFVVAMSCVPLLGVVLGVIALRQIRRRGLRGRGFAIAGTVLNGLWTLVIAAVITLGSLGYLDDDSTYYQDLFRGDCVSAPDGLGDRDSLDVVPCSEPHEGEVYAVVTGASFLSDDGGYPGDELMRRYAEERCGAMEDDYVGDIAKLPASVGIHSYTPSRSDWSDGDRDVICLLGDDDGGLTGSLESGSSSGSSSDDASV